MPLSAIGPPADPGQLIITFDQPLVPAVLSNGNWSFRYQNNAWAVAAANSVGSTVEMDAVKGAADPGPDALTYDPPPFDVIGSITAKPAAAFTDFFF